MSFLLRALKRQKPRSEHACCSVLTHSRVQSVSILFDSIQVHLPGDFLFPVPHSHCKAGEGTV